MNSQSGQVNGAALARRRAPTRNASTLPSPVAQSSIGETGRSTGNGRRLPYELLSMIDAYLDPIDMLALSAVSRDYYSLFDHIYWLHKFKADFGPHGLEAREMFQLKNPESSWQAAYSYCAKRKLVLCHHFDGAQIPAEVPLPRGLLIKDIAINDIRVYVLTNEGIILSAPHTGHDRFAMVIDVNIEAWQRVGGDLKRVPFTEMAAIPYRDPYAIDSNGDWWLPETYNMSAPWRVIAKGRHIWPGTLAYRHQHVTALSACGRNVYATHHIDGKFFIVPLCPALKTPLSNIDGFGATLQALLQNDGGNRDPVAAFLHHEETCYLSIDDSSKVYNFDFKTDIIFLYGFLVRQGSGFSVFLWDTDDRGYNFYLDEVSGIVTLESVSAKAHPEHKQPFKLKHQLPYRDPFPVLAWDVSGKIYSYRSLRAPINGMVPDVSLTPLSIVDVPPVSRLVAWEDHVIALVAPERESTTIP